MKLLIMFFQGTIRGPRPFGPGGPRMPRILGPEGAQLHARPRFVARTSLEAQGTGPNLLKLFL